MVSVREGLELFPSGILFKFRKGLFYILIETMIRCVCCSFLVVRIELLILKKHFHPSILPSIYWLYRTQIIVFCNDSRGLSKNVSNGEIKLLHFMLSSYLGEKLHWCSSWLWRAYSGTVGQIQCWSWEKGVLMTSVAVFCWMKYFAFVHIFTRMKNLL